MIFICYVRLLFLLGLLSFTRSYSNHNLFSSTKSKLTFHTTSLSFCCCNHVNIRKRQATTTTIPSSTTTQLKASPLVSVAASPLGSLFVLAVIVLIHECGHYFAARIFGIQVEEFSVGVGPKVFGFEALGNSFNLRALPLGGYVKFPENFNTTLAREIAIEDERAFSEYIRQQKLNFGKQLLNAVTLGAVVDKMWIEEKEKRKKNQINQESQQKERKSFWNPFQISKTSSPVQKKLDPVLDEIEYYDDPSLLQNRPWPERAVVISGGVVFNLLLAFLIYFGQINVGPGLPQPVFSEGVVVSANPRPDAPAMGSLHKGDVILAINGNPVTLSKSPSLLESNRAITEFITKIRSTPEGEQLVLDVRRAGVDSSSLTQIYITPKRSLSDSNIQTIGVLLSPNYVKSEFVKTDSVTEAAGLAYKYVKDLTIETAQGLTSVLVSLVSVGSTENNGIQVTGPIGLIRTGSEVVATKDIWSVLLFAAAISINLGVVNALPIPALDGGQMIFIIAEAITGRKVDQRFEESITGVAVLFLILLTASTFVGDLSSIIMGR